MPPIFNMKKTKNLKFLDIVPDFRSVADLVEGLDCLEDIIKKDTTAALRERLMIILRRLERVDSHYYEKENHKLARNLPFSRRRT